MDVLRCLDLARIGEFFAKLADHTSENVVMEIGGHVGIDCPVQFSGKDRVLGQAMDNFTRYDFGPRSYKLHTAATLPDSVILIEDYDAVLKANRQRILVQHRLRYTLQEEQVARIQVMTNAKPWQE